MTIQIGYHHRFASLPELTNVSGNLGRGENYMLNKIIQAAALTLSLHLLIGLNALETKAARQAVEPSEVPGEVIVALKEVLIRR